MHNRIRLYRFLFLLALVSLLLSGCGRVAGISATPTVTAAPATDTPQPAPTSTPQPAATATSTATETPAPTATLDRTATVAAKKTAAAEAVNTLVAEDLEDYGVDPADGHVVWVQSKAIKTELTSYAEHSDRWLDEAGTLTDFVVQTRITWTTSGALSLCGVTFHAQEDREAGAQNKFMMMRLQYDPAWTIWKWEYGQFQSHLTGGFVPSYDIHDESGSSNLVALVVRGKDIDIYLNHDKQRRVEDAKLKEGMLALSSFQESGRTQCAFEDTWVWAFDK